MMIEINDLLTKLRDAGDHNRDQETGAGPLVFCHQAADTIEQLRRELAEVTALGEDHFGANQRRNASGDDRTVTPVHARHLQQMVEITGNPILDAFAARPAEDIIRHWRNAVEDHRRIDGRNGSSDIAQQLARLAPTEDQATEAEWVLSALASVVDDERTNSDISEASAHDTDGDILLHVRNTLRMPGTDPVPGSMPVELDGSPLSLAYIIALTIDERLLGTHR